MTVAFEDIVFLNSTFLYFELAEVANIGQNNFCNDIKREKDKLTAP